MHNGNSTHNVLGSFSIICSQVWDDRQDTSGWVDEEELFNIVWNWISSIQRILYLATLALENVN